MKLSKINIRIDTKTKEECLQKINLMNSLDLIEQIDVTPKELAKLIDNGYSLVNAVFSKKHTIKKPVWEVWSKDKTKRRQAVDDLGENKFKEVYNRSLENVDFAETMSFDIENEYGIPYKVEDIQNDLKERNLDCFNIIYETYSHGIKGDRYRLIGSLSRPVSTIEYDIIYKYIFSTFVRKNEENLLTKLKPKLYDKIYFADISCSDISKINFPGKVIYINEPNVINVDLILKQIEYEDFEFIERIQIKEKKYTPLVKAPKSKSKPKENSIELNVDTILDYLYSVGKTEIDYNYRYDVFNQLFKFTELLDEMVGELFPCVLPDHMDTNASAYIYIDNDGSERYHCWGCGKRYNIVQFIKDIFEEELGAMTDLQFFKYIEDNTNLKFGTLYQKESYNTLCAMQDNVYTVRYEKDLESARKVRDRVDRKNGYIVDKKSSLNRRRGRRSSTEIKEEIVFNYLSSKKLINFYNHFLLIARNNISLTPLVKDEYNRFSFFYSIRALSDILEKMTGLTHNQKTVQDKLKALAKIGIIEYADTEKLDEFTKIKAFEYKKKNKYKHHINFFIVNNILDNETLTKIANNIQDLKSLRNKSVRDMTFEQVYRDLGKEEAYRLYPQFKGKEIELEDKKYKNLKKIISNLFIENQGYFTEDMLKKKMSKRLTVKEKEKIIKTYINQIMKDLDITYTKVNKNVRESFHTIPNTITNKQYVYIMNKDKQTM